MQKASAGIYSLVPMGSSGERKVRAKGRAESGARAGVHYALAVPRMTLVSGEGPAQPPL